MLGEAKVIAKLVEMDIPVSIPFGDNYPYDLIAEFNGKLNKIQVKSSTQSTDGSTKFSLVRRRINTTKHIMNEYSSGDVDYFALYAVALDEIYLIQYTDKHNIYIRYADSISGQVMGTNNSKDFLIDNVLHV